MFTVPNTILAQYASVLRKNDIVGSSIADYKKWLRYYLDFCEKHPVPDARSERVRLFCEKLREKKQSDQQRQQAAHAVSLYFEIEQSGHDEAATFPGSSRRGDEIVREPAEQ